MLPLKLIISLVLTKKLINKGPLLKFLTSLLECDPKKRINAKNSLTNKLFNRFKHLAEKCDFKKVDLVQEFEFIEYEYVFALINKR
jgi:hypothetical protein